MAKSIRSKREKRLRAIRREMIEPLYEKKDAAKLAAQEAALNEPKLAVKPSPNSAAATTSSMDVAVTTTEANVNSMDVDMGDGSKKNLLGVVGKHSKRQFKVGKRTRHGKGKGKGKLKGKVKRRHI